MASPIACRPHFEYHEKLFADYVLAANRRASEEYGAATGERLEEDEAQMVRSANDVNAAVAMANRIAASPAALAVQRKPLFVPLYNKQALAVYVHSVTDAYGHQKHVERLEVWVGENVSEADSAQSV